MLTAAQKTRVALAIMIFFMIAAALWVRLLWLQVLQPDHWMSIARRQHVQVVELPPLRGSILDRNGKPLALSLRLTSVFADPRHIKNGNALTRKLAPVLQIPEQKLREEFARKHRGFVWLKRKIPNSQAAKIRAMRLPGVHLVTETQRFYPHGYLASQVLGFAGMDNQGLEGIEMTWDRLLKGEPGWRWLARDARSRNVGAWDMAAVMPRDGLEMVLTLDTTIQYIAERALEEAYLKHKAKAACIVVSDPYTGEILALANRPSYDPNRFSKVTPEQRRNRAVTDMFEPGSVFKIVTAATALGTNSVRPEDTFFCENGNYAVAGRVLHDHHPHGTLTFRQVITESSNIGVAKVAMKMGIQPLYNGIRAFGVGEKTGVDLPGESRGAVTAPKNWSKSTITTVPMGHEVAVNALHLAQIISVVANGGTLVRPWIVREIRDPSNGTVVQSFKPRRVRQVITPETSAQLKEILAGVVEDEEGTGKAARVEGYRAAGKTGTAQKLEPNGQYSHTKFTASFIGFVPVERPRLSIVVVLDEPKFPYFGGVVSAPVFKRVATDALAYLGAQRGGLLIASANQDQNE